MLHLRKRGDVWHVRGTVKVGQQTLEVPEFSSGCGKKSDAEAVAAAKEADIRKAHLEGDKGKAKSLTLADCFLVYLKDGRLKQYDKDRIASLNEAYGSRKLTEAPEVWREWRDAHAHLKPATQDRMRATLAAALVCGADAAGLVAPKIKGVGRDKEADSRVPYLTETEADRLIANYSEPARWVAITLRYQGLRTQEALRLDWRNVDWRRRTMFITGTEKIGRALTKSRRPRTIAMHRKVRITLYLLWRRRGRPASGAVFLSSRGQPYQDTRGHDGGIQGGNPLRRAHDTACKRAGIRGFRVHDWRHHWAAWMVMKGCDLITLQKLGGWSTLRMVERYSAVSVEHQVEAMRLVA